MKKEKLDTTVKIQSSFKGEDLLALTMDKIGPKRTLDIMFCQCLRDTLETAQFPSIMLASGKDEENADVTAALYYLRKNWKTAADKGMKMLAKNMKKHYKNEDA